MPVPKRVTHVPLKLLSFPVHTDLQEGSDLTLRCTFESSDKYAEIFWFKDGKDIRARGKCITKSEVRADPEENNNNFNESKFHLYNSDKTDSGNYSCHVKTGMSEFTATCQINVLPEEKMLAKNQNLITSVNQWVSIETTNSTVTETSIRFVKCHAGKTASISLNLSGEPRPEVVWYKNESKLAANQDKFLVSEKPDGFGMECEHILKIKKTDEKDAGIYTALAKNSSGMSRIIINLEILGSKPDISARKEAREELICQEESLTVEQAAWSPNIMCEEPEVLETSRMHEAIPPPKPKPAEYRLISQDPEPEGITVEENEEFLVLTAEFNFDPKLVNAKTLIWQKENETIDYYDGRFTLIKGKTKQQLVIKKMTPNETDGNYTCFVADEDGSPIPEATATFKLDICPPRIYETVAKEIDGETLKSRIPHKQVKIEVENQRKFIDKLPEVTEFVPGDDIVLECEVGSSIVRGYWFKNNEEIKYKLNDRVKMIRHGKLRKLKIENANVEDSGIYRCETMEDKTETEVVIEPGYANPSFFQQAVKA